MPICGGGGPKTQCVVCSRLVRFAHVDGVIGVARGETWNGDPVCSRCKMWSIHAESSRGKCSILEAENERMYGALR